MQIPSDSAMLISFLNMKLRDCYDSLDELCDDLEIDRAELDAKLSSLGLAYDEAHNRVG